MSEVKRILKNLFFPDDALAKYLSGTKPQLPFVVRPVSNNEELLRVAEVRLTAYRATPREDGSRIAEAIDQDDYAENALVLAAFAKETEDVLGTIRLAFSPRGPTAMNVVGGLPADWHKREFGEARLLCVPISEHNRVVTVMLCKAFYLACLQQDIATMLIGSRKAMEPFYRILGFDDISEPATFFRPPPSHTMAHRVMSLNIVGLQEHWLNMGDRDTLLRMFFDQEHADIQLGNSYLNPLTGLDAPESEGKVLEVGARVQLVR